MKIDYYLLFTKMSEEFNVSDYELVARMVLRLFGTNKETLAKMNSYPKILTRMDFLWRVERSGDKIFVSMSKICKSEDEFPKWKLVYTYKF